MKPTLKDWEPVPKRVEEPRGMHVHRGVQLIDTTATTKHFTPLDIMIYWADTEGKVYPDYAR